MPNQTPAPLTPEIVSAILRDPDSPHYPTEITVYCDRYGCDTEHTGDYMVSSEMDSEERLAVARQHLVGNEGWEHNEYGDDFCPEHAGSPSKPQALVELEAQGCTTWQLTPRDFSRIADEVDRLRPWVFSKSYWQEVDGKNQVVGLRVGEYPGHVVARFGDWLVRHPDGTFTVHAAPAVVETGE